MKDRHPDLKDLKETDARTIDSYGIDWSSDFPVCSSTDCTGLIPALPENSAQLESYEELYPYLTKPVRKTNHPGDGTT